MYAMLSCVIIDDEIQGIESLKWKLNASVKSVNIVGVFSNPQQALIELPSLTFDVLFLDIEMPLMTGFELLDRLPSPSFEVIFVTAHMHYKQLAKQYNAVNYLLKPVAISDLEYAICQY